MYQRRNLKLLTWVFIGVALYAFVAMVVSRELVIPHMMQSKDGDISGDPQYYRSLALRKAEEIRANGIGRFELRPDGQGPAGVASIFYSISRSPYGMVLLNAVMHALATVVGVLILRHWFSLRTAIIAALPMAISPYMIAWFSQINKDSFVLLGALLFIHGLTNLINPKGRDLYSKEALPHLFSAIFGIALIWIVRPYVNQVLLPASGLILMVGLVIRARKAAKDIGWMALYGSMVILSLGLLGKGAASGATLDSFNYFEWEGQAKTVSAKCLSAVGIRNWRDEQYLPEFVDEKLKAMAGQRCLMFSLLQTQSNATTRNSIMDTDRLLGSSADVLAYFPRAALLGIFSPWPDRWGYVFHHKPSMFYTITPVEAALLYIGLAGLIIWMVSNQAWSVLIPITVCTSVMTTYGMATPFLGALYRYRYPWWMLLICLGIAAFITILAAYNKRISDEAN